MKKTLLYIFLILVFYGLHKRFLWGWKLNWGLILIEIFTLSNNGFTTFKEFLIRVLIFTILWGVPNYIYFKKRKILFE